VTRRRLLGAALVAAVVLVGITLVASVLAGRGRVTPTTASGPPRFSDETDESGLDHVYEGAFKYATGGGVAAFDCDGDRLPDLYLAGGEQPAALFRNESRIGGPLRFSRIREDATDLTAITGAYPIDIDGDDHVDLAVLRVGESVLLRGLGGCRFERANERWSFDGGHTWAMAFSATFEKGSTLPTLAVGDYRTLDTAGEPGSGCAPNRLYRSHAGGSGFAAPTSLEPGYCALSMLFSDWDRSGRRDLRVSNDRQYYDPEVGQEQLWRVEPGAAPRLYTAADGWVKVQVFGMGIASHDITRDGYPEVFLTSQADNKLQTLTAGPTQPTYRDIALRGGVTAARPFSGGDPLPSTAWHAEFADVNNDGFVDLFIAKGNVSEQPGYAMRDPSNLLVGQPDGTFAEGAEAAGIVDFDRGRGGALVDLDHDGLVDLVEVHYRAPVRVFRNTGGGDATRATGHWLAVELDQPGPNRDAIGAWIEVRVGEMTLRREVTSGGGHSGGQLGWIHFGLGPATTVDLRVQWPDGEASPWMTTAADRFVIVERGAGEARRWEPGGP
jgi:hypothetical protein